MTTKSELGTLTLIGAHYSVYTRICQLALHLKSVPHGFETLDVFAEAGNEKARQAGNPFGKIPILHHGDLTLYETLAITRYIDQAFDGPPLQPEKTADRARMNQIISLVDTQVYPVLVWGLHVPRTEAREPEPSMIDKGHAVLAVLEGLTHEPWLCGNKPSLADAYLAACMDYILESAAASHLPGHTPRLMAWWHRAQALQPSS